METTRRDFLKTSSAFTIGTLISPGIVPMNSVKDYKMGLQLYTIRDAMEKDPLDTLLKVKAMGYVDFETYGYDVESDSYYGYKSKTFREFLDDNGLSASSGHYGFADYLNDPEGMKRYVDACIHGATILGKSYITWPWLPPESRNLSTFERLPDILNKIGEQVKPSGLGFAYHNHNFEFEDYGGFNGYDIILKETDPSLVKLQLDMYWAVHSSPKSPTELIAQDPSRFVMWHIKDMDKVTRDYSELGNGSIDYHEVLSTASQQGLEYYYIEQGGNYATNSMKSVEDSAQYFKKELIQYFK